MLQFKNMDQFGNSQKIVIVEDNTSLAEIYKVRLEVLGYTIFVAYDGIVALNLIQKELPDLVLLDLMVPKIAGDQILETMRKSDWGRTIPVCIISNLNEADAPAGLREMGIEGYAVKANLSNDELDKLVDSILTPASQKVDANALEASPDLVEVDAVAEPLTNPIDPTPMSVQPAPPAPAPIPQQAQVAPPAPAQGMPAAHANELHVSPSSSPTPAAPPVNPQV